MIHRLRNEEEMLKKTDRIYIAGHRGMVGSAILRRLQNDGYESLITRSHAKLDLTDQAAVRSFFRSEAIDYVVLTAAKVGGIHANNTYPADFIYQNLTIEANVIHEAHKAGIERLLFLGSSCVYPRLAPQPLREEYFLTGQLEPTNEPYAIAKIAGINLCESYNRLRGTHYRAVMPTNSYGPNDTYDLEESHLMAAMIRKLHLAKLASKGDSAGIDADQSIYGKIPDDVSANLSAISRSAGYLVPGSISADALASAFDYKVPNGQEIPLFFWGTGTARREFLHVDDMAEACIFVMGLDDNTYGAGLNSTESQRPLSFYNVGTGEDHTVRQLTEIAAQIVGYTGKIGFDSSKPDGMPRKLLQVDRLKSLGWQPKVPMAEGIRRTYESYCSGQSEQTHLHNPDGV